MAAGSVEVAQLDLAVLPLQAAHLGGRLEDGELERPRAEPAAALEGVQLAEQGGHGLVGRLVDDDVDGGRATGRAGPARMRHTWWPAARTISAWSSRIATACSGPGGGQRRHPVQPAPSTARARSWRPAVGVTAAGVCSSPLTAVTRVSRCRLPRGEDPRRQVGGQPASTSWSSACRSTRFAARASARCRPGSRPRATGRRATRRRRPEVRGSWHGTGRAGWAGWSCPVCRAPGRRSYRRGARGKTPGLRGR